MRNFSTILKFELSVFIKKKGFVIFTAIVVAALALLLFSPRYLPFFEGLFAGSSQSEPLPEPGIPEGEEGTGEEGTGEESTLSTADKIILNSSVENKEDLYAYLQPNLEIQGLSVVTGDYSIDEMKTLVDSGEYLRGLYIDTLTSYTSVVKDAEMMDYSDSIISETLKSYKTILDIKALGADDATAQNILNTEIQSNMVLTGVNQAENFFYTYILIFMLYIAVLLYGQFVVMNVITEKTSRAMEVLITSAKSTTFIFAKVIAAGLTGFLQLGIILASAFIFYNLNLEYWGNNPLIGSVFAIPIELLGFMLLFFIVGFFLYAFLFAAAGSLVSKIEDSNSAITPIMLCFVAAFLVTMTSLSSGNMDSGLMYVCSFIPLTSPMAMFSRIAMSNVPPMEILISVVILFVFTAFIAYLAARIYRLGTVLYGNKVSFFKAIKMVFASK